MSDSEKRLQDLCNHMSTKCISRLFDIMAKDNLHPDTKSFIWRVIDCCEQKRVEERRIK